jgi:alkylhydroperoxidase/carboxymuconolactone decarboxylase family protein YurZ
MARIRWIEESEATGEIAEVYAAWMKANPGRTQIPGILKALSLRPELFRGMDEVSGQVHFRDGHLTRRLKEMIATYVSALNRCPY